MKLSKICVAGLVIGMVGCCPKSIPVVNNYITCPSCQSGAPISTTGETVTINTLNPVVMGTPEPTPVPMTLPSSTYTCPSETATITVGSLTMTLPLSHDNYELPTDSDPECRYYDDGATNWLAIPATKVSN